MKRFRLTYQKSGTLRYTGSLDVQKVWERTFRRAKIGLAYTQGFHPQPRLNQANPLPLGFSGKAELIDSWIESEIPPSKILELLQTDAPPGLIIDKIEEIPLSHPPLQSVLRYADYQAILKKNNPGVEGEIDEKISQILAAKSLTRQRRGKNYDLRPLIISIHMETALDPELIILGLRLESNGDKHGRPDEVLLEMGLDPSEIYIERSRLILATDT